MHSAPGRQTLRPKGLAADFPTSAREAQGYQGTFIIFSSLISSE
jgi:hypothetical protein